MFLVTFIIIISFVVWLYLLLFGYICFVMCYILFEEVQGHRYDLVIKELVTDIVRKIEMQGVCLCYMKGTS